MRLLTLLFVIPELALSQPASHIDLPGTPSFDTLQKYSYLIILMRKDGRHHERDLPYGHGTGFFLRKDKRLYLISARHLFSNCDPINRKRRGYEPVAIKIWYQNSLGKPASQLVPVPEYKIRSRCDLAYVIPDVDTMDVSDYVTDGQINAIDSFMPDYSEFRSLSPGDTVVAFGYSHEPGTSDSLDRYPDLSPVRFISYSKELPNDQKPPVREQMSISYYSIGPGLPHGVSGAPVFRISSEGTNRTIVEFSGIQSSTRDDREFSYIVKEYVLAARFHLK